MNVSLVIPLFNERDNLRPLAAALDGAWRRNVDLAEIILVNDGSTDGTGELLDELAGANPCWRAVHLRRNYGQTAAIMAGIDRAEGDVVVLMDGDLQNDPADIPRLLAKLAEGYDVCSGWRQRRRDKALSRRLPSWLANRLISLVSGVRLNDYGCTLKAYRREVIAGVKLYGEMHRFIPIYARWQGARICELPVTHHPRTAGRSKYGLGRTFKVLLDLLVVKFLIDYSQKPIYFFGQASLLFFTSSFLGFAAMVYYKYFGGKSFIETPLPQLVVMLALMGFMTILMGVIAELQMRTYYESQGKPSYIVRDKAPSADATPADKV
jgi:glycosyltransferase involved in cell wall biosynthesis